jgi:hypothetical protein
VTDGFFEGKVEGQVVGLVEGNLDGDVLGIVVDNNSIVITTSSGSNPMIVSK